MAIEILNLDLKFKYLLKIFQVCPFYVIREERKEDRPNKNKGRQMEKACLKIKASKRNPMITTKNDTCNHVFTNFDRL
jgi:hypothetical protein